MAKSLGADLGWGMVMGGLGKDSCAGPRSQKFEGLKMMVQLVVLGDCDTNIVRYLNPAW